MSDAGRRVSLGLLVTFAVLSCGTVTQRGTCQPIGAGGTIQTHVYRVGPVDLPRLHHHPMVHASLAEVFAPGSPRFEIPMADDAWLVAFVPRVVDQQGRPLPGALLHHAMLLNRGSRPYREEEPAPLISAAAAELMPVVLPHGYGIPLTGEDLLELRCMFHNPFPLDYAGVFFEVEMTFQYRREGVPDPKAVDVVLFSVEQEGAGGGYWVPPGSHARSRDVQFPFAGTVVFLGAHLHAHAQSLTFEDLTHGHLVWIARPRQVRDGRLVHMPTWASATGWPVSPETRFRVTARYDNPTPEPIDAMGFLAAFVAPDGE